MPASSNAFARVTDAHELFTQGLPPCARSLYRWLLRRAPAGKTAEIHLEEFQNYKQGAFSGRGYTLHWIKKSLQQLIDLGAVDVAFKYSSKVFKLITWHPDRQSAEDLKRSSPVPSFIPNESTGKSIKSFSFDPSNPHSVVPLYRELRETTNSTTQKTVSQEGQERAKGDRPAPPILRSPKTPLEALLEAPIDPPTPQIQPIEPQEAPEQETKQAQEIVDPIAPEISEKIKIAGFKLNSTLATIVRSTQAQIVLDAIEAAQQYLTKAKQEKQALKREPEAVLVSAIKNQWQPNKIDNLSQVIPLPDNFEAWYEVAKRANIARASSSQAEVTRHPQGVLCIETNGSWSTFDEMARCFPIPELEEMARIREEAIDRPSCPPDHLKQQLAGLLKNIGMP
jgi:hypothetical protein